MSTENIVFGRWQCCNCHAVFGQDSELEEHIGKWKKENIHACPFVECSEKIRCALEFSMHLKEHSAKMVVCEVCGEIFQSNKNRIKQHLSAHSQIQLYKCMTCGQHLKSYLDLQTHNAELHNKCTTDKVKETSNSASNWESKQKDACYSITGMKSKRESFNNSDSDMLNIQNQIAFLFDKTEDKKIEQMTHDTPNAEKITRLGEKVSENKHESMKRKSNDEILVPSKYKKTEEKGSSSRISPPLLITRQSSRLKGKCRINFKAVVNSSENVLKVENIKSNCKPKGKPLLTNNCSTKHSNEIHHGEEAIEFENDAPIERKVSKSITYNSGTKSKIYIPKKRGRPCRFTKPELRDKVVQKDLINNDSPNQTSRDEGNNMKLSTFLNSSNRENGGYEISVNDSKQNNNSLNENNSTKQSSNMKECAEGGKVSISKVSNNVIQNPEFICDTCNSVFSQKVKLVQHMRMTNHKQICKICHTKMGYNASNMKRHMKIHLDSKPHVCSICSKAFKRSDDLHIHKRSHLNRKKFECKICANSFFSKGNLLRHLSAHENNELFCPFCEQSVVGSRSLFDHVEAHHEKEATFLCSVEGCGKRFCSSYRYINHIKSAHANSDKSTHKRHHDLIITIDDEEEQMPSEECKNNSQKRKNTSSEMKYTSDYSPNALSKNELIAHCPGSEMSICKEESICQKSPHVHVDLKHQAKNNVEQTGHHSKSIDEYSSSEIFKQNPLPFFKVNEFMCCLCNQTFSSAKLLLEHGDTHKDLWPTKICFVCNKKILVNMKYHIAKHFAHGQFMCRVCKIEFPSRIERTVHKQCHNIASGQHPCPFKSCVKVLSSISNLARHIRLHTETKDEVEGDYKCDFCPKSFICREYLRTHINRQHSNKNETKSDTYLCPVCGEYIKHLHNLKRHMKGHMKEKPHVCKICEKKFSRTDDLKVHMRSHLMRKLFTCTVCSKIFRSSQQHFKHMTSHAEKVSCLNCGTILDSADAAEKHHLLGCSINDMESGKNNGTFKNVRTNENAPENKTHQCSKELKCVNNESSTGEQGIVNLNRPTTKESDRRDNVVVEETCQWSNDIMSMPNLNFNSHISDDAMHRQSTNNDKEETQGVEFVHTGNLMTLVMNNQTERATPVKYVSLLTKGKTQNSLESELNNSAKEYENNATKGDNSLEIQVQGRGQECSSVPYEYEKMGCGVAMTEGDKEIIVVLPHTDTGNYICTICDAYLEGTNTFVTHMVQHTYPDGTEVEIDFNQV